MVTKNERIATLSLNQPENRNAVHVDMHNELEQVWADLAQDTEIGAIVLTGSGKSFSAGGDVKKMVSRLGTEEGWKYALSIPSMVRRLLTNMLEVGHPIIAAVNGDAIGLGATLALFCDTVVISETAKFGDTHVRVGLVAGDGGAVIWPLLIGPARAKDFLMRGRLVTGKEAQEMGLVSYSVPADQVLTKATEIAQELEALPALAVRWTKLAVNKSIKEQLNQVIDASAAFEALSMVSQDHKEAAQAFLEKRRPVFKGM